MPFCYTKIPISNASREDLNLIEIAIGREEQDACSEDWTSLLNINLQHCVKAKKSSPSSNIQHLLSLGGLFSYATPDSNASSIKWIARKLRSKRHSKRLLQSKPSDAAEIVKDDMNEKKEHQMDKDVKLIQYSRKRYKAHASAGIHAPIDSNNLIVQDALDTDCDDPDKEDKYIGSFESQCVNSVTASTVVEDFEAHTRNCQTSDEVGGSCQDFQSLEVKVADGGTQISERFCSGTVDSASDNNGIDSAVESETFMEEETVNEACDPFEENDGVPKEASRRGGSNCSDDDGPPPPRGDEQIEEALSDQHDSDVKSSRSEGEQHILADGDDDQERELISETGEHHLDETNVAIRSDDSGNRVFSQENNVLNDSNSIEQSKSTPKTVNKRKRESSLLLEDQFHGGGFIRSPCERLRPRAKEGSSVDISDCKAPAEKSGKATDKLIPHKVKKSNQKGRYKCELDGCIMTFQTKTELQLHEGNRCPVDGCRKKFNSHKYAIQHQRVHDDDRPLKCSWEGCSMSFKWAWARTEHLRVHTGERPYVCKVKGCGLTFRFVSDFSRHRRKMEHYVSRPA